MNSLYKSAKIIQLKTIIQNLGPKSRAYNVESVAKRVNEELKLAQEEYKVLTGEYLKEWMPVVDEGLHGDKTKADKILNAISSSTFEKWYAKDFDSFIAGDEKAKSKEDILKDIDSMFYTKEL